MAPPAANDADMSEYEGGGGYYMNYLASLCIRRNWPAPKYSCRCEADGFTCVVQVNGREYQTDLPYQSDSLAQENAAMRAWMVCRNFSLNGGMLARNGIVQGLPAAAVGGGGNDFMGSMAGGGAVPAAVGGHHQYQYHHRNAAVRYPVAPPIGGAAQQQAWDAAADSQSRHNRSNSNSTASSDGQ
jgi:hypothetical protein